MRASFTEAMDRTKESVSQIAIWCIVIAAHQRFGIGSERIRRVVAYMDHLRQRYVMQLADKSRVDALRWLHAQLPAGSRTDFPVPLHRATRNRKEEQLRMAADQAAGVAWCLYAAALHEVLGFGRERLEALRQESIANYRQFGEWQLEDEAWAFDRLRRCAEAAVREDMTIVDADPTEQAIPLDDGLHDDERRMVHLTVTAGLARQQRPAGWAVLNQDKLLANAKKEAQNYGQDRNNQLKGWRR